MAGLRQEQGQGQGKRAELVERNESREPEARRSKEAREESGT